jgi:DNA-binding MarR family transcriptional regulator
VTNPLEQDRLDIAEHRLRHRGEREIPAASTDGQDRGVESSGFGALRAAVSGADNASELGRRLSVSKQAAAKTIAVLEDRGYVARAPDPEDRRRKRLQVTPRGSDLLREGDAVFEDLHRQWGQRIGAGQLEGLEEQLTKLVGASPIRFDTVGWMAANTDGQEYEIQ